MLATGCVLVPAALIELFRYSPYEDPGAGKAGLWLGISALILIGIPVVMLATRGFVTVARAYRTWKKSLTPSQRTAVQWAETAGLTAASLLWHRHNRKRDAELTESVMGSSSQPEAPTAQ